MIKEYGLAKVQYFEFIAKRPHKYTVFELQMFKKQYQAKLAELRYRQAQRLVRCSVLLCGFLNYD